MTSDQFWSLTLREFHLKHAAFMRADNRARALVFELALLSGHVDEKNVTKRKRDINQLREYPIKSWLR